MVECLIFFMSFLFKYKILINSAASEQKLCLALLHRIVAITLKKLYKSKVEFYWEVHFDNEIGWQF